MDNFVELHSVTKTFKSKSVLKEVSLSIPSNQVTAIVGKNGSGKSTLLKMIGGIVIPDSGQILFQNGESVRIGYVPEVTPNIIPFTPQEYLTYMGKIRGLPKERLQQRIDNLLELFHMEEYQNTRINYFSKGMKQKITIMQALLEETDLLIMDEPLSGLDLKTQSEFEDLLLSLKERNFNIILTCHETKLIEKVVDQMFIIHDCQVTNINSKHTPKVPMNRIVFEIADSISMHALQKKITIRKSTETSSGRLIEVSVNNEQTDRIVKEFIELGASIKLLEPLQDVKDIIRIGEAHA